MSMMTSINKQWLLKLSFGWQRLATSTFIKQIIMEPILLFSFKRAISSFYFLIHGRLIM